MQTELLADCDQHPRLEYNSKNGEAPDVSPLLSEPFSIGRIDSADLQVDSNRVSREHALIERQDERFRVRDLGSTNGTFLNGEQIEEAWLNDGDILTIADTEFTFLAGGDSKSLREMPTQLMGVDPEDSRPRCTREVIAGLRRLQEMSFQRAFAITLRPLIRLDDNEIEGWSMIGSDSQPALQSTEAQTLIHESSAHVAAQFRQLVRMTAVKEFRKRRLVEQLLFAITPIELNDIPQLKSHLLRLTNELPSSFSLIAALPGASNYGSSQLEPLRRALDELGIGLAFETDVFNGTQLLEYPEARPSHVILKSNSFAEILSRRPSQQQLSSLLATLSENGSQLVADGISEDDDVDALRELGFRFGFRSDDVQELAAPTAAETHRCELEGVASSNAQSTQAEIAKVTARIRASWSK